MLDSITIDQLKEWHEFWRLEPFGLDYQLRGFGIVASVIANTNRGKKTKPFKPEDFMPQYESLPQKHKDKKTVSTEIFNMLNSVAPPRK